MKAQGQSVAFACKLELRVSAAAAAAAKKSRLPRNVYITLPLD